MMFFKDSNYSYIGGQTLAESGFNTAALPQNSFEVEFIFNILMRANQIFRLDDFEEILSRILDLMIEAVGGQAAMFFLVDSKTDEIISVAVRGSEQKHVVGHRWKIDQGLIGMAASTCEALVVDQLSEDQRWLYAAIPEFKAQFINTIILPLQIEGRTAAIFQVYNYTRSNLELLRILGDLLVTDLEWFCQLEANRQEIHRLMSLIDIFAIISGTLDREQLLRKVTEQTSELVQAERSSVFLYDSDSGEIASHVSYHSPSEGQASSIETSHRKVLERITQQEIDIHPGSRVQSQIQDTQDQDKFSYTGRSALTVPLEGGSIVLDHSRQQGGYVLGGLMALKKHGIAFDDQDAQLLKILADQTSTILQVSDLFEDANQLLLDFIKTLAAAIDAKDPYTRGHSLQVSNLSVEIARELGLQNSDINDLRIGSLLHDVGKIGIHDNILKKPGKLSDDEYQQIQEHPQIGYNIITQVQMFKPILPAIVEHHERLDGTGYPKKLVGDQISLMGRIVAVADVFDALTNDRPYRKALDYQTALDYMRENVGTHFDPRCFQGLIKVIYKGVEID
jgi:putative nucleotidyltransferase with HDIG domain